ncbi:nucleolar protein 11 [Hyperolius riggenbachi]|uniref:nucleolar protein 11 n=1 Tax=Hyperolius riggenbachi TaxID=752182 RepID=UPI0035A2B3CF
MAALCEELTLCGLQTTGLQGVEAAGEEDTVLVTGSDRTVTLYKVSDQRPLGSWAVKQGQRLTSPAVCNHGTGEYVVVHDEKVLRVWKDEDVNFDKVFKTTLSADVWGIHSLPDCEPLILFRGGAVQFLDSLLADPRQTIESVLAEGEAIRWSKMFVEVGQPVLVFITEKVSDIFVNVWRPSLELCHRCKLDQFAEGDRALHFSAALKNKMVSLFILCSSGQVCQSLVPLAQSNGETEVILSVSALIHLPEAIDTGAVLVLDDSHIATLTPSTAKQKDCLCIWNTSFQTMQDCKEFSQKTKAQLWNYHSRLFVPHGNSLQVVRYVCEPSSLAAALGKESNAQNSVLEPVPIVNWAALLRNKTTQAKPSGSKKSSRVKSSQDSGVKVFSAQDLLSEIQTASSSQIPTLVQRLSSQDVLDFHSAVGNVMQGLVNRCQNNPKFYPQRALMDLIMTKALSYSLCPDLMVLGLEKSDVQLLQLCLQQFTDIPESALCSCLKVFLSISEDVLSEAILDTTSVESYIHESESSTTQEPQEEPSPVNVVQNGFSPGAAEEDSCDVQMFDKVTQKPKSRGCPVSMKRAVLLNTVLTSSYSDYYLLPHLKDLTSDQVILFLRYLQYLYRSCNENVTLTLPGEGEPTVTQVIDWMNLLLDANFTVLVMQPKAKPMLYSLQKFVRQQMKLYSELNKLKGSLSELQNLQRLREDCGRYSIEVLELY